MEGGRGGVQFTFCLPGSGGGFSRALLHQRGRTELAAVPTASRTNGTTVTDPVSSGHLTKERERENQTRLSPLLRGFLSPPAPGGRVVLVGVVSHGDPSVRGSAIG